ncbi:hypothetical protein PG997_009053 [Apiospora hydei]|uniref:Uncharacterized protein n=1 Tax=Apiospora hydei TaxID=1337664 RepID=A0ABR1VW41_9PEZI
MPSITTLASMRDRYYIPSRRGCPWPVHSRSRTLLSGLILWLPSWEYLQAWEDAPDFKEDYYGHPVVILSPRPSLEGTVELLLLTSFNGKDLKGKHPHSAYVRSRYLPLFPSDRHPDNEKLLWLEHMWPTLWKKSYVNTATVYEIEIQHLRPYDSYGSDFALCKESYQEPIEYCGY